MAQAAPPAGLMQAPATWDAVAPTYAADIAQWDDYARESLRRVPIARGQRVLDLACGPGTLAFLAAPLAAQVDAVDFSPGMVAQLRERAAQDGVANVKAAVMDAHALEFPEATFDAVFCLFAFFFFPDRARVFQEVRRVLRPGGRLLMATWGPIERRPVMQIAFEAVAEALPHLPRPAKGDLQQPKECIAELTQAEFHEVAAHVYAASTHFDSAEQYLDAVVRSAAPFALMRQKLGEVAWRATRERLLEAVQRRFPRGGAELSAEAILSVATR